MFIERGNYAPGMADPGLGGSEHIGASMHGVTSR